MRCRECRIRTIMLTEHQGFGWGTLGWALVAPAARRAAFGRRRVRRAALVVGRGPRLGGVPIRGRGRLLVEPDIVEPHVVRGVALGAGPLEVLDGTWVDRNIGDAAVLA